MGSDRTGNEGEGLMRGITDLHKQNHAESTTWDAQTAGAVFPDFHFKELHT
jgi:hypothetical protein